MRIFFQKYGNGIFRQAMDEPWVTFNGRLDTAGRRLA